MSKKKIFIIVIIIVAVTLAYFYISNRGEVKYKVYTAEDFPQALDIMTEEVLEMSLIDLNKQYDKLADKNDEYTYIRWINVGILKKRLNDYTGAEEAWQKAISYNPDQALAYGNLADMYLFDLAEYEKAEEYYNKVLSMKTDNYSYYFGLAALYRYNMTEKAYLIEDLMLGAVERNPGEAQNYYMYLADYFYREGNNWVKSKYYKQRTLELDSGLESQLPTYGE